MILIDSVPTLKQALLHKESTDTELIMRYLSTQNHSDFSALYDRYSTRVYSKCLSLLKSDSLAEDALQEIFLKIFLNLANFNFQSQFSTWVYSVTYNYCIDFLRRQRKERDIFTDTEFDADSSDGTATPNNAKRDITDDIDDAVMREMNMQILATVLERIATDDKMILLMKYQDELSIKEICDIIDKSESAVKMKLKRAKHRAKQIYESIQR